jgi:hypothetical protein
MKPVRISFVVAIVVLVLGLLASVALADSGDKVTGQGKLNTGRTFSFQAQERADGTVDGSGLLVFPNDARFKYDITCLNVEGNVATMSGHIRSLDLKGADLSAFTGMRFYFRVTDNGQGDGDPADQTTFFLFEEPPPSAGFYNCYDDVTEFESEDEQGNPIMLPFPDVDIIAGNITVH